MSEQQMPKVEPLEQHRWLQQLVGEWVGVMDPMADGTQHPPSVERVRALGDVWVQGETHAEIPGMGPIVMQLTLGYNALQERFVGTWLGSMMTHLWVYDGQLDATGKSLVLNAEGPDMMGNQGMAKYHDIITFVSPDERTLISEQQQPDGSWKPFMKVTYKRK